MSFRLGLDVLVLAAFLCPHLSQASQNPGPARFGECGPALRLEASFRDPAAERSAGETRLSRLASFPGASVSPDVAAGGVKTLAALRILGPRGGSAFDASTDASLRALGSLNAQSGTVSVWVKRSSLFQTGGFILVARSFQPGGRTAEPHWALGIGGIPDMHDAVPRGALFLATGRIFAASGNPIPAGEWIHLAATWDRDRGAKLYVDGRLVGSSWDRGAPLPAGMPALARRGEFSVAQLVDATVPAPVERIHLVAQPPGGGLAGLQVYDGPLVDRQIAALAAGKDAALEFETSVPNAARRLDALGWSAGQEGDLIDVHSGQPVMIRSVAVARAYEDRKASGHLAIDGRPTSLWPWWYHGYRDISPRRLHLIFPQRERVTHFVAVGTFRGRLQSGGRPADPGGGIDLAPLSVNGVVRRRLPSPIEASSITVTREAGSLGEIRLLDVSHAAPVIAERNFTLCGSQPDGPPLPELARQEFVSGFAAIDRRFLVGSSSANCDPEDRWMEPLVAHHLLTPPADADVPFGGIQLRLFLRGITKPMRLKAVLHDAVGPWRELASADVRVVPATAGTTKIDLSLLIPPTLLRSGDSAWVTIWIDDGAALVYDRSVAPSVLSVLPASRAAAERGYLEHALACFRDAFEEMSEFRPWGFASDDPATTWWLSAAWPQYEEMDRIANDLRHRFPSDTRVQSYYQWTHPEITNPARSLPIPAAGADPEWAVLAHENLRLLREFARWWSTERAAPNGELGNGVGDDTDLLQDWADLSLIADDDGLLRRTLRNLADGAWDGTYRVQHGPNQGQPLIRDGLNVLATDAMHAYEEGLNVQAPALLLDYGAPRLVERLMETAARYDGYLLTPLGNGRRSFAGSSWGTSERPRGDPNDPSAFAITQPGMMLLWWCRHPRVLELFQPLAAWKLAGFDRKEPLPLGYGAPYFFRGLWQATHDPTYLEPLLPDLAKTRIVRGNRSFDPSLVKRLPRESYDAKRTLEVSLETAPHRFDSLLTRMLAYEDRRYDQSWLEWWISRDEEHLLKALRALYQRLRFTLPALTVAEQSGDRVAVPKSLISQMYLGGAPAGRAYLYPDFAVSYDGLGDDFAALVLDDTPDSVKVRLYGLGAATLRGGIRVHGLQPGRFHVRMGIDANGDDEIDVPSDGMRIDLTRGDAVPIELPSRLTMVFEARLEQAATPLAERPDVGIGPDDVRVEGREVLVQVHSLGAVPSRKVDVALRTLAGAVLARKTIELIEAPLDFRPRVAEVRLPLASPPTEALVVELDPEKRLDQITRRNDRVTVDPAPR